MKDNVIAGLMAGIMVLGCTAAFDGCSSAGESMETSAGEDTVDTVEAVETSETASKTGTAEDYPNSYIISLGSIRASKSKRPIRKSQTKNCRKRLMKLLCIVPILLRPGEVRSRLGIAYISIMNLK